jgi:hypothetical protein
MRRFAAILTAAVALSVPLAAGEAEDFAKLLEGRYDNELQVFFEKDKATPNSPQRENRHVVIRKSSDAFFSVQIMSDARADHPLEEVWAVSERAGSVETAITGFSDKEPVKCTATWRREGAAFAVAPGKGCNSTIAREGATLTAEGLETGQRADGLPPDAFKRIRPFECWVAVLRGAKHGDAGRGAKDTDWFFKRGVWIHDQGGVATIATDESPAREIKLRLRRVAWPSGPNRPSLTLYVMEPGDDRAVSYAWGEFDAERLGLNLRWMQASCTHAPDKVFP